MDLRASRSGPLQGVAAIPGDKSCSHRALILCALATGETHISGLLESDDVAATVRAVAAFGAAVERLDGGDWLVRGAEWHSPPEPVDCGNSGTAARLLIGAAAGFPLTADFTGDTSLSRRPMGRLTARLTRMGARFEGGDRLPLTLHVERLGREELPRHQARVVSVLAQELARRHNLLPIRPLHHPDDRIPTEATPTLFSPM